MKYILEGGREDKKKAEIWEHLPLVDSLCQSDFAPDRAKAANHALGQENNHL